MDRTKAMIKRNSSFGNRAVAVATTLSFVLSPAGPLLAASAPPQASPAAAPAKAAPTPKASPAATPQPVDGGWPRAYSTPSGGKIVVYQPQVASWTDQKRLVAYSAVAYD